MHYAVCEAVLPGPEAAARAAAAAPAKRRAEAESAIARAVADALHLLGALRQLLPLMDGAQYCPYPRFETLSSCTMRANTHACSNSAAVHKKERYMTARHEGSTLAQAHRRRPPPRS